MFKRIPLQLMVLTLLFFQHVHAQRTNQQLISKFDSINRAMPREKIYVHFDKNVYTQVDTIWYKVYLFDESLKSASTQSGLIYAELIDARGNIIKTVSLPTGTGLTWGGFALDPKSYLPGDYTFRAYTNWMQNFDNRYLFTKDLKIISLKGDSPAELTPPITNSYNSAYKSVKNIPGKSGNIDLQFLPEGGNWVANRPQLIAFKAIGANGKGIRVEGNIVDSKQNKVAAFSSNQLGMGTVNLTPKSGESYSAIITSPVGIKGEPLPKVLQNGVTLHVKNDFSSDSITITLTSDLQNEELILIGQARGLVSFVAQIKPNVKTKVLTFSKNIFPSGISQITVFNGNDQPINERSFFINHQDQLQIKVETGAPSFGTRDSIPIRLIATNAGGVPLVGSFSMAVTDDTQVLKDSLSNDNILSYLLLSSDLKGEIENPNAYFHHFNEQKHNDVEALVLTQGWASYLTQPKKTAPFKVEKDFTISGTIDNILNKRIAKANVSLFGKNQNKIIAMQTVANEKGEFVFDKLPPLDSASLVIQALNNKDKSGTLGITLYEFKRPLISISPKSYSNERFITDSVSRNLIKIQKEAYYSGEGVTLNEVNIKGKKSIKNSKNLNGPGEADQVISEEELNRASKKTLYDILYEQVKGFQAKTVRKSFDREFFIKNNRVKIVIDGMNVDDFYTNLGNRDDHYNFIRYYLENYKAEDITGIEVLTSNSNTNNYDAAFNPKAYLLNAKGDFLSYLEITTKTGSGPFLKKSANMYIYKPITYGDLKVFYSPKYHSTDKTNKKPDLRSTIYWVPNLVTDINGTASTFFFSADKKGSYTIWIEGTDMNGNIGMKTMTLKIK